MLSKIIVSSLNAGKMEKNTQKKPLPGEGCRRRRGGGTGGCSTAASSAATRWRETCLQPLHQHHLKQDTVR